LLQETDYRTQHIVRPESLIKVFVWSDKKRKAIISMLGFQCGNNIFVLFDGVTTGLILWIRSSDV